MKKIIFCLIFIFLFSLAFAGASAVPAVEVALAEDVITLAGATHIDAENNVVEFNHERGLYGAGIRFYFESSAYAYSYRIYKKSSGIYSKVEEKYGVVIENGEFYIAPSQTGELKLEVIAENEFAKELGRLEIQFLEDNIAPYEPTVDLEELAEYHITPYNLAYNLNADNDSGMDFEKCYYIVENLEGETIIGKTIIKAGDSAYGTKYIGGINAACKVTFVLYDLAGNSSSFSYTSAGYGITYGAVPEIIVEPESEYAKSVNVTIDWGEEYNNNPYAPKYYAITSGGILPVKTAYTDVVNVDAEGATIIAYYYTEEGLEKTVSKEINNVDSTKPSASLLEERFSVSIDLTASPALYVKVYAFDGGSGIGRVYDNYGNTYEDLGDNYYGFSLLNYTTFNVIAEDKVGNKVSYGYSNPSLDYALMQEYHDKFVALNENLYSTSGWNAIISAYTNLNLYLLDSTVNTNGILQRKNAIEEAINVGVQNATRYSSVPMGLAEFTLLSGAENTDVLLGDIMRLLVGTLPRTNAELNILYSNAMKAAGMENGIGYSYSIDLVKNDGSAVNNKGSIVYSFKVTSGFKEARLFFVNEDDTLEEMAVNIEGNTITAYSLYSGEYILVTNDVNAVETKESFPLWAAILIAVAIIIVVAVVAFFAVYSITKKNDAARHSASRQTTRRR